MVLATMACSRRKRKHGLFGLWVVAFVALEVTKVHGSEGDLFEEDSSDKNCHWKPAGETSESEQVVNCHLRIIDFRSQNTSVSSVIHQANKKKSTVALNIQVQAN